MLSPEKSGLQWGTIVTYCVPRIKPKQVSKHCMNMSIVPWGQSDLLPCVCVHWKITHPIRFPRNPEKNPSQVPKSHKILLPPKSAPKSREIPLNPHQLLKLCSGNPGATRGSDSWRKWVNSGCRVTPPPAMSERTQRSLKEKTRGNVSRCGGSMCIVVCHIYDMYIYIYLFIS
jgi:hypothetical protein